MDDFIAGAVIVAVLGFQIICGLAAAALPFFAIAALIHYMT